MIVMMSIINDNDIEIMTNDNDSNMMACIDDE